MSTNKIDQLLLFNRLLIIFGSICFLWLIIGLVFLSIETYRHLKKKTNQKLFHFNPSSLLTNIQQTLKQDYLSDNDQNDDDDDRTSVLTSISFISERSKTTHEHTYSTTSCKRMPEEQFTLTFPPSAGFPNLAYSPSTITSSSEFGISLLYYPAYQNFAYSQSTLSSSIDNFHQNTSTPSLFIPLINSSSKIRQFNFERQSSQSSTNTLLSQITNATYISSKSSMKTILLPTVMITDVDRLQTDIIELEDFEPEKERYRTRSQLRFLLNEPMPYEIK